MKKKLCKTKYSVRPYVMHAGLAILVAASGVSGLAAVDQGADIIVDRGVVPERDTAKLDKALATYTRTGKTKTCLSPIRIRSIDIVDDYTIIFKMRGKRSFLNVLPRRCHSLDFHDTIQYDVRGGMLCKGEIFRVLGVGLQNLNSCTFGAFEQLEKKTDTSQTTTE